MEDTPVVAIYADMGPHSVIVSEQTPSEIQAIIDWEFVSSAPYASLYRITKMLFRKPADNGFGAEFDGANKFRVAFWGAIPDWEWWNQSEATQVFLEWFKFGLFMKPEWGPSGFASQGEGRFLAREHPGCRGRLGKAFAVMGTGSDYRRLRNAMRDDDDETKLPRFE